MKQGSNGLPKTRLSEPALKAPPPAPFSCDAASAAGAPRPQLWLRVHQGTSCTLAGETPMVILPAKAAGLPPATAACIRCLSLWWRGKNALRRAWPPATTAPPATAPVAEGEEALLSILGRRACCAGPGFFDVAVVPAAAAAGSFTWSADNFGSSTASGGNEDCAGELVGLPLRRVADDVGVGSE